MNRCHFLLKPKRQALAISKNHAVYIIPSSSLSIPYESVPASMNSVNTMIVTGSNHHFKLKRTFFTIVVCCIWLRLRNNLLHICFYIHIKFLILNKLIVSIVRKNIEIFVFNGIIHKAFMYRRDPFV